MRIPFIAGNWKMFKTVQEAVVFVKELRRLVKDVTDVEIVVAPPFTAVHAVAEAARNTNIGVAAQDLYWEREGAFTGEVSPGMIKEAGAEYVIVGHSERRRLFGETDADRQSQSDGRAGRRADADRLHRRDARRARAQRDARGARSADQGRARTLSRPSRSAISSSPTSRCGPSAPAGTRRRRRPARRMRTSAARLRQWFGAEAADRCHVIYGGSVKPDNIRELIAAARRRRRARRRREPRRGELCRDRDGQPAGCGIISWFHRICVIRSRSDGSLLPAHDCLRAGLPRCCCW